MTTTAKVLVSGDTQTICIPKKLNVLSEEVVIVGAWPRLVITPKRAGRDSWKDAVNGIFGACPDFDTARTGDAPRKAAF